MTAFFSALVARYLRPRAQRLRIEHGLEAVEYALIAALISAILVVAITAFGTDIQAAFTSIGNQLTESTTFP